MPRLQILLPIAILCAGLLLAPWSPLRSTPRPAAEEYLASIPSPASIPTPQSPASNSEKTGQTWHEPEVSEEFIESPKDSGVPSDILLDGIPEQAYQLTYLLKWLHGTSVRAFEAAPQFGSQRMADSTIFNEPTPPKHQPFLYFTKDLWNYIEIDDDYLIQGQPAPSEAWLWLHLMQGMTPRGFVYRTNDLRGDVVERTKHLKGFGGNWRAEAMARESAIPSGPLLVGTPTPQGSLRFHHHPVQLSPGGPLDSEDRVWKIRSLQLVGLLKHDAPMAYETHELEMNPPGPRTNTNTRTLNELEIISLEKLRQGTQRVAGWDESHQRLQFMGAIRAKDRCLKCHYVVPGTLLGAFTYWIEEKQGE